MEISLKSSSLNNLNLETVSEDKQWQLDRSILKAWMWLEFLLKPDNPFVIDMFKTLNNRYNPPSPLDGWTAPTRSSLYNYIITTPNRKEHFIQIKRLFNFPVARMFREDRD
ncbi:41273_t:CDS:2 [Gigaspora margarita]|uniref:41273_t:CDS:1 n=1 Tax=Gigaspora margarita TaxID=4874 RepID=A0ABN7VX00_GIGMA|nr:41273_t:CDS:2 [Gigaspora margarita]